MIEHPFPPEFDGESRVLILGSFPSVASREQCFFYGHPRNRFWTVTARVFGCDVPETIEEKKRFLHRNHLALWDVLASCEIVNSADASIRRAVPNDLTPILSAAPIRHVFLNGTAAGRYYDRFLRDRIGQEATVLPSTSPANAAWSVDRLTETWRVLQNFR